MTSKKAKAKADEPLVEPRKFKSDFRKSNPRLHRLYVSYAVAGLATIDKSLQALSNLGKTSMIGAMAALQAERAILVNKDAAYAEADFLLQIQRAVELGLELPDRNDFEGVLVEETEASK